MLWISAALAALPIDEGIRPPRHARAVVAAPAAFAELDAKKRPVRLWWDQAEREGVVEAELGGRWKVVARGQPGLTTKALAPGTRVRVRLDGGAPTEPLVPWAALGPGDLGRLQHGLPAPVVADIAAVDGGAWAALLEGGLAALDQNTLVVTSLGRAQGLPTGGVNTVAADGETVWVGTEQGLARVEHGRVERIYTTDDGLPDDWVQALRVDGDQLWVGTYRGLARVSGDAVEHVLGPWSVFWIGDGADERTWVAYEGLQGLPEAEPIEGVDADVQVWDVDLLPPRTYLATQGDGVLRLEEGLLSSFWRVGRGEVYALERHAGALWAASDAGLAELSDVEQLQRLWGTAHGLPDREVYEVVAGPPGKLWVGTAGGVALMWPEERVVVPWPLAPTASIGGVNDVVGDTGWALLAGDDGLAELGKLPRAWRDAAELPGPVEALVRDGDTLWVVGAHDLWRVRRGRLARFPLPDRARCATLSRGQLWVGTESGLARFEPRAERFVAGPDVGAVHDVISDGTSLWALAGQSVVRIDPDGDTKHFLGTGQPLDAALEGGGLLVATPRGVQLIEPESGEVASIAGTSEPVAALGGGYLVTDLGDVLHVQGGAPVQGGSVAEGVGEVRRLRVDGAGRVWVLGSTGAWVLPR